MLGFTGASGEKHTVARRVRCTVKKNGTRTMSTLEGTLTTKRNGERTAISSSTYQPPYFEYITHSKNYSDTDSEMGELDKLVPQRLGVSEAVLENVIFCHQDDSLWPMSSGLELKKKFDTIFDATKWTKAVDNLRSMKKEKNIELAQMKIHESNLKVIKNKGAKVKQRMLIIEQEIEDFTVEITEIDNTSAAAMDDVNEKRQQAQKAAGYKNKLDQAKHDVQVLQRQINETRETLVEFKESDEELTSTLVQYEERMALWMEEEEGYRVEDQDLSQNLLNSRRDMSERQAERGQHLAEKASYEDKLRSRALLVKDAASRHEIRGYDGDLGEDQIAEFVSKLRKLSIDKDRELVRLKELIDDELQQTRAAVEQLGNQRTISMENKSNANRMVTENDRQSARVQRDIDQIKIDEGEEAAIKAELVHVGDNYRKANEEFEAAKWDQSLKSEQSHLRELDGESDRLRKELEQCAKLASERAQLDHQKNDLNKAQSSLDTMASTYGDQLSSVLGAGWRVDTIEREYQSVLDQRARTVTDLTKKQDVLVRELNQVDYKLATLQESLKKKTETRKNDEATVLKSVTDIAGKFITTVDDFETGLAEAEDFRKAAQKELDGAYYFDTYFEKCQSIIDKHEKCRLCDRKFADQKEKLSAQAKLQKFIEKNVKSALQEALDQAQAIYKKAAAARPQFDRFKALNDVDIPNIEKEIREAESKREGLLRDVEKQDYLVKEKLSAKRDIDGLSKTVAKIASYASQISERQIEIDRISSQQKLSGTSLTSEELNCQISTNADQIRHTRSKIDTLSHNKQAATKVLSALELEKSNIDRRLNEVKNQLEKKQDLLNQLDRFRESTLQHRAAVQRANADLETLLPQITKAKAKDGEAKTRGQERERQIQGDKDRLADTVNKFDIVEKDINKYLDDDGPRRLAACQRAIKDIQDDQARIEGDLSNIRGKASELRSKVADGEHTKRSIEQNLRFRKNLYELDDRKKEVADLEARNLSGDLERLSREAQNAEIHYQNLMAKRAPLTATVTEKDRQLKVYIDEWESDYKTANQDYRKMHVEVETLKVAIQDMEKFRIALDQAIMKYHSLNMEEINRIVDELWRNTYRGTDIDSIIIRSDPDTADSSSSKRNYNYRVCMVKEQTEMDMRGRCSAGQKVLACIIIRLALAEVLGVGCGVSAPALFDYSRFR
jgi:DNA repair protein RAD50